MDKTYECFQNLQKFLKRGKRKRKRNGEREREGERKVPFRTYKPLFPEEGKAKSRVLSRGEKTIATGEGYIRAVRCKRKAR